MSINSLIRDGEGSRRTAGVTNSNALKVTVVSQPVGDRIDDGDFGELTDRIVLYEQLTTVSGVADLDVDGSVTAVDFEIRASNSELKVISEIRLVFNDQQMSIGSAEGARFGTAAAAPGLPNGVDLFSTQAGIETRIFVTPVKQIVEFLNWSTSLVNETGALGAGEDLLVVGVIFPVDIAIVPGSVDKLTVRVQDNLTSINKFLAIAIGYKEVV